MIVVGAPKPKGTFHCSIDKYTWISAFTRFCLSKAERPHIGNAEYGQVSYCATVFTIIKALRSFRCVGPGSIVEIPCPLLGRLHSA